MLLGVSGSVIKMEHHKYRPQPDQHPLREVGKAAPALSNPQPEQTKRHTDSTANKSTIEKKKKTQAQEMEQELFESSKVIKAEVILSPEEYKRMFSFHDNKKEFNKRYYAGIATDEDYRSFDKAIDEYVSLVNKQIQGYGYEPHSRFGIFYDSVLEDWKKSHPDPTSPS